MNSLKKKAITENFRPSATESYFVYPYQSRWWQGIMVIMEKIGYYRAL